MHRSKLIVRGLVVGVALAAGLGSLGRVAGGDGDADAKPSKPVADGRSAYYQRAQATIELNDLTGKPEQPLAIGGNKAAVVIFVLHDCPISNQYAPEIRHLADEFAAKKVPFYLVHVDPELTTADAKKHAKEYGYKIPVLIDRKHALVRRLKATKVPEAFLIGPDEKVLYHGRIDDRYAAIGKPRNQVQRRDLRMAIAAVIEGKPVEFAETKAIGCYIPELDSE